MANKVREKEIHICQPVSGSLLVSRLSLSAPLFLGRDPENKAIHIQLSSTVST